MGWRAENAREESDNRARKRLPWRERYRWDRLPWILAIMALFLAMALAPFFRL
jgi:hypothetical protein